MQLLRPFSFAFAFAGSIASAQTATLNVDNGFARAIKVISAQSSTTPSDEFALGALHFLNGIEKTLQLRWEYNATLDDVDLPVLRLPVPTNPNAKPFDPALITTLFTELLTDMDTSRAALGEIPNGTDVALDINLADLWFDINMNGTRDIGEGVIEVGAFAVMGDADLGDAEGLPPMDIRFDTADVAWLTAYTHLISGVGELVVAFDPTQSITSVMNAAQEMDKMRGQPYVRNGFVGPRETVWIDQFAMVYGAINQQPDPVHTRAAHAHLLNMIAENKTFWAAVDAETDNEKEWIPNARQTAALGFVLPPETGAAWQRVLADIEAMLNGELLIDYWRISPMGGVNVKKLFMDPPVVDIVTWVQGAGLLPYLERGPVISGESFRQFEQMTSGNAVVFSFLFN